MMKPIHGAAIVFHQCSSAGILALEEHERRQRRQRLHEHDPDHALHRHPAVHVERGTVQAQNAMISATLSAPTVKIAMCGVLCVLCVRPSARGMMPSRPSEYQ